MLALLGVVLAALIPGTARALDISGYTCGPAIDPDNFADGQVFGAFFTGVLDAGGGGGTCQFTTLPLANATSAGSVGASGLLVGIFTNGGNKVTISLGTDATNATIDQGAGPVPFTGQVTLTTSTAQAENAVIAFDLGADRHQFTVNKPAGLDRVDAITITRVVDATAPTLAQVTPVPTPTMDTTPAYTFSSDEAGTVTYGGACSSATTNAIAGNTTVTFNALAVGTYANCTITVTDAAGNASAPLAVNSFTIQAAATASQPVDADPVDGDAPTVTVSGAPERIEGTGSFSVTVTFSEAVTGFTAGDLAVTNGSVSALTGSGASYSATIAPTGAGDVVLNVPAGAAQDAAGNGNTASNTVTVRNDTMAETGRIVTELSQTRGQQVLANQPDLVQLLTGGGGGGGFDGSVTQTALSFDLSTGTGRRVWALFQGSFSQINGAESGYALGALGGHLQPTENLLLGAMVQLDYFDGRSGVARTTGLGWLAGPYVVARLPDQPLTFDARLLYGQGANEVSPFGTYTDDFTSDRWLAQAGVTGRLDYARLSLLPALRMAHSTDTARAYTDSLGNRIPTQGAALTELGAGMGLEIPLDVQAGALVWTGGIEAIWASTTGTGASALATSTSGRGRVDMGLNWRPTPRTILVLAGFYDGLGLANYASFGANLTLDVEF